MVEVERIRREKLRENVLEAGGGVVMPKSQHSTYKKKICLCSSLVRRKDSRKWLGVLILTLALGPPPSPSLSLRLCSV